MLFWSNACMKTKQILTGPHCIALIALATRFFFMPQANAASTLLTADAPPSKCATAIEWSQIGARAGVDYHGEGLAVSAAGGGSRLRCVFQQLEGEATPEGLWLTSTVSNALAERFCVVASSVGRRAEEMEALSRTSMVTSDSQTVRLIRPGLVEEYSVSMDGVRQ